MSTACSLAVSLVPLDAKCATVPNCLTFTVLTGVTRVTEFALGGDREFEPTESYRLAVSVDVPVAFTRARIAIKVPSVCWKSVRTVMTVVLPSDSVLVFGVVVRTLLPVPSGWRRLCQCPIPAHLQFESLRPAS